MTTATEPMIHKWEFAGLGKAPFRVVGLIELPSPTLAAANPNGYSYAAGIACQTATALGVSCGTCDVCGTGIMNNFVIQSADRKRFVVGCDCVQKSDDAGLVNAVKAAERKRAREKQEAKRQAEWERTRPEREARERAEQAAREERLAREAATREANLWILEVLDNVPGDFAASMVQRLEREPIGNLSLRMIEVIGDIYAKAKGGRRGSKAYDAALAEFDGRSSGLISPTGETEDR